MYSTSGERNSTPPSGAAPSHGSGSSLLGHFTLNFLKLALGRWWRFAVPAGILLALTGGIIVYFVMGPVYESEAWVRIEDVKPSLAFHNPDSPRFINTQIELVRNPLVLGPVLAQPEIGKLPEVLSEEKPLDWLSKRVSIRSVGGSELYKLVVSTADPVNGPAICNAVLDSYIKIQEDFSDTQSQRTVELLNQELRRRQDDLQLKQRNLKELARQVTGKDPGMAAHVKNNVVVSQLTNPINQLNQRLASTEVERQVMEAEQKAVTELLERNQAPITAAMLEEGVEQEAEMLQLRAEIQGLEERLFALHTVDNVGKNHPTVKSFNVFLERAKAKVAPLREKLTTIVAEKMKTAKRREQETVASRLQAQVATHSALENLLREKLKKEREELQALGDHSLDLEFARAELFREESVYERIAERAAALRTEMRAPNRVTQLRRSSPTDVKLTRDPLQRLIMFSVAGFLAPFVLAVVWERRVRRVSDSEQVSQDSKMRVIAEISDLPQLPRGREKPSIRYERLRAMYEESVDLLRHALTLPEHNRDLQVISVCSAVSGEGKTSLACQLAVSLARAVQSPVLLIDGDMRAPDVHRRFEIDLGPGLSEVLGQRATTAETIHAWTDHVHLLPAGRLRKSPHTLVNSNVLKPFIDGLRSQYRYIVIDCPPLLAASESFVMAKTADGALLCAMRDVSKAPQVRFASELIHSAGVNCLGLVLNGVRSSDYGYRYGGYSYQAEKSAVGDATVVDATS